MNERLSPQSWLSFSCTVDPEKENFATILRVGSWSIGDLYIDFKAADNADRFVVREIFVLDDNDVRVGNEYEVHFAPPKGGALRMLHLNGVPVTASMILPLSWNRTIWDTRFMLCQVGGIEKSLRFQYRFFGE